MPGGYAENLLIIDPPRLQPKSIAILPGSFNPPTRAHVAIACTAAALSDGVLFTLPRILPHKDFIGASLEQRISMLRRITERDDRFGTALADGGLYADMAREARQQYPDARIRLVCGRDAAERIVNWQYDETGIVEQMLADFDLLVAPRGGRYEPPENFRQRILSIDTPNLDAYSSTRLRELIASGGEWRELAPDEIVDLLEEIYRG